MCIRIELRCLVAALVLASGSLVLSACRESDAGSPDRSKLPAFPVEQATIAIRGRVLWNSESIPRQRPLPITIPEVPEVPNPKWAVDKETRGVPHAFVEVLGVADRWRFESPDAEPLLLSQDGYRYQPWTLGLRVGRELEVRNKDDVLHNLKWTGKRNGNANQNLAKGQARRVRFTRPETVRFQCDVHNWMDAWIYVREHPIFAVTESNGSFELPPLPPGTYELRVLHPNPSWTGEARRIEIRDGADSRVELTMGAAS